jgi:hypothetical protein
MTDALVTESRQREMSCRGLCSHVISHDSRFQFTLYYFLTHV